MNFVFFFCNAKAMLCDMLLLPAYDAVRLHPGDMVAPDYLTL